MVPLDAFYMRPCDDLYRVSPGIIALAFLFTERRDDVDVFLASRDENSLTSYENVKERGKLLKKNKSEFMRALFLTRPEEWCGLGDIATGFRFRTDQQDTFQLHVSVS